VMAAPARNLRRVVDLDVRDRSVLMGMALLGFLKCLAAFLVPLGCMNRPDRVPIPVWQVVGGDIAAHKARIVSPRR